MNRSVSLYGCAAAVLLAGAAWYTSNAPPGPSPRLELEGLRLAVTAVLPPADDLVVGDTFELAEGATRQARAEEMPFAVYEVLLACAGEGRVRAQLGRSVNAVRMIPCDRRPVPVQVRRGLSGDVVLNLTAETNGTVVFGWQLFRPER